MQDMEVRRIVPIVQCMISRHIKYAGFEKEKEKVTEKNKYRIIHFERDENYIPICPAGHKFTVETMKTQNNEYQIPEVIIKVRNEHCQECPMRNRFLCVASCRRF